MHGRDWDYKDDEEIVVRCTNFLEAYDSARLPSPVTSLDRAVVQWQPPREHIIKVKFGFTVGNDNYFQVAAVARNC